MVTQALTAAGTLATNALANQKKRDIPVQVPRDSIVPFIAATKKKSERKHILNAAREEKLWDLVSQPQVIGLAMTLAGIYAAQHIRFVPAVEENGGFNDTANEILQATATSTSVLIGLGHAGIGDLTTAVIAGLAGVASVVEGAGEIVEDVTSFNWNPLSWKWPLGPIWNR